MESVYLLSIVRGVCGESGRLLWVWCVWVLKLACFSRGELVACIVATTILVLSIATLTRTVERGCCGLFYFVSHWRRGERGRPLIDRWVDG